MTVTRRDEASRTRQPSNDVAAAALDAFVQQVPGARFALTASRDGRLLNSCGLEEAWAVRLAAGTLAMCSIANAVSQRDTPQIGIACIDLELYMQASDDVCLLVGTDKTCNVDDVSHFMHHLTGLALTAG